MANLKDTMVLGNLTVMGTVNTNQADIKNSITLNNGTYSGTLGVTSNLTFGTVYFLGQRTSTDYHGLNIGNNTNNITLMDDGNHGGIYDPKGWSVCRRHSDGYTWIGGYGSDRSGYPITLYQSTTVNGSLYVVTSATSPAFYATSDRNLKTNISTPNINYMNIINSINVKEYSWKKDGETSNRNIGVIAQELRDILPEQYKEQFIQGQETEENPLTVNDSKLVYFVIGALQEQNKTIQELQQKIEKLERGER